jgi:flagellar hook-length control protein FliK
MGPPGLQSGRAEVAQPPGLEQERGWGEVPVPDRSALLPPFALGEAGVPASAPPPGEGAVARHIARQMLAQPALRTGGTAEMTLSPEELGPLRLSVEVVEGGLRLVIEAVRPETADLLRRHVETLRQELRQDGLGSVGVSIGGGDARRGEAGGSFGSGGGLGQDGGPFGGPALGAGRGAGPSPAAAPAIAGRGRGPGGHLDIRF